MKVISLNILAFVSILFAGAFSVSSHASTITPTIAHSDQISIVSSTTTNGVADLLQVRVANTAGISVNRFDNFEITDTPLSLVNVPRQHIGSTETASQLIVIIADTITLQNTINVIGPAADILFLSTGSIGAITCDNCVLNNFHRVTFAATTPETAITDDALTVGNLNTASGSYISVNRLTTSGSLILDLVANVVTLNGEIYTHQRAEKDSLGGYRENASGAYSIGTGSVNLLLGSLKWDYDNQELVSLGDSWRENTLGGTIKSVGVKVIASSNLTVNTRIDTRTDLLSSTRYKNEPHIPIERVNIQTFGATFLNINGNQETSGNVVVRTTGNMNLDSNSTYLRGSKVELIAQGNIQNSSIIKADHLQVAALNFQNEGYLNSSYEIEVWSDNNLINQYGGSILANTIKLQSENGLIRNGSRTPYQTNSSEVSNLLGFGTDYVGSLEAAQLGTFYTAGINIETSTANTSNYVMAIDSSAKIVADSIEIAGIGFENINAYYQRVNDQEEITFEPTLVQQVEISAENSLSVHAVNYIVNSSAQMKVHDKQGDLRLRTELFTNERYRTLSILDGEVQDNTTQVLSTTVGTTTVGTTTTVVKTKTVINSPPALLLSMGDLEVVASKSFINNTAYLEVFGNAVFNTPIMHDIGIENKSYHEIDGAVMTNVLCGHAGCTVILEDASSLMTNGTELDSLFFVQGDAAFFNSHTGDAVDSTQIIKNHSPMDSYISQAVDNAIDRDSLFEFSAEDGDFNPSGYLNFGGTVSNGYDYYLSDVSGTFTIDWSEQVTLSTISEEGVITPVLVDGEPVVANTEEGTASYSIVDELIILIDKLVDYVASIFAEIDWWSVA